METRLTGQEISNELWRLDRQYSMLYEMQYDLENNFGPEHETTQAINKWLKIINDKQNELSQITYTRSE